LQPKLKGGDNPGRKIKLVRGHLEGLTENKFAQDQADSLEMAQPSQTPIRQDDFKDPALL